MNKATLFTHLNEREKDTFEELEGYFEAPALLIEAIKKDEDLSDAIHEIADGRINPYTHNQIEWLMENIGRADQEYAVKCGATSAQEIAVTCWFEAEREDLEEDINAIRKALDKE